MDDRNNIAKSISEQYDSHTLHNLKKLNLTVEESDLVQRIWDKLQGETSAFDDVTSGRQDAFLMQLFLPNTEHFVLGDEQGYMLLEGIRPGVTATAHYAIWDKTYPLEEVKASALSLIDYAFKKYNLARVTAYVPGTNISGKRMAALLGFKYEGEMRDTWLKNGKLYGVQIYGLLKSEYISRKERKCHH